jgi:Threonine synthase
LILRTIRESDGFAIAVEDFEVEESRLETARETGVHLCPEGSACLVAYEKSLRKNLIRKTDQAVLFNCASGLKSPMPVQTLELDVSETIDYSKL